MSMHTPGIILLGVRSLNECKSKFHNYLWNSERDIYFIQ